jgi:hypothetical protein
MFNMSSHMFIYRVLANCVLVERFGSAQLKRYVATAEGLLTRHHHSLLFSLTGRVGRKQSPVMWPVWLWHTASWASFWGSLPLLSPILDVPTFVARCLYVRNDARDPSSERWNCGREMVRQFCLNSGFHINLSIFYMPQIYNVGPTTLLPLRRKAFWWIFRPKNVTASTGFFPGKYCTKGQHANPRPPKPLWVTIIPKRAAVRDLLRKSKTECWRHYRNW